MTTSIHNLSAEHIICSLLQSESGVENMRRGREVSYIQFREKHNKTSTIPLTCLEQDQVGVSKH